MIFQPNSTFKIFAFTSLFILCHQQCFSQQVNVCLGNDATICTGQTVVIQDCNSVGGGAGGTAIGPYQVQQIPFNPDPYNVGTAHGLTDDSSTGLLPIGFDFCFFGNTYSNFLIGSNGWISFTTPQPNTFTSATIPNVAANVPKNCIMSPWQDWHPGVGANVGNYIRRQVYGTAPFRRLVVSYNAIPFFSCTSTLGTFQIIIYETTNVVETHILNKPACTQWAGGTATHGLHNMNGTIGVIVPGRNSAQWTTQNEGYRFTPGVQWVNSAGQTFPYNNGSLTVVPPVGGGTVGYWLAGGCGGTGSSAISDTTWLNFSSITGAISNTTDFCGGGVGTASFNNPNGNFPPFTYNWSPSGQATQNATNLTSGTQTLTVTDAVGCTTQFTTNIGNDQPTASATATLESCTGSFDGSATAQMNPPVGTLSYLWNDPQGQTTQTAVGLTAGTYTCTITSSQNCTVTANITVQVGNPMVPSVTNIIDVNCHSFNNGGATANVVNGNAPFTYDWSGSSQSGSVVNNLFAGNHTVLITDALGCNATVNFTVNQPPALTVSNISLPQEICPGASANISATGSGGSTPYIYNWFDNNGVPVGQGSTITVTPNGYNTQYCVVLSEQCGSPTASACTQVSWPEHITPTFWADTTAGCNPTQIAFQNTTASSLVNSIFFQFGNGNSVTVNPTQIFNNTYTYGGLFNIQMTVTTVNGCVYDTTYWNHIEIGEYPTANFSWYPSQIPMFNPVANFMDASSNDVTNWYWQFESGTPISSSDQYPSTSFPEGEVGEYLVTLIATTEFGCSDTMTNYVPVISDVMIFAPNTFTPDFDDYNQGWRVHMQGIDVFEFQLIIFDRWGQVVWESYDVEAGWEGTYGTKPAPEGTYVWKIRTKNQYNDNVYQFNGHINLIR
jgi:gliding motility-associated-like protein